MIITGEKIQNEFLYIGRLEDDVLIFYNKSKK